MTNNTLAEIAALLKNCRTAAVCCHVRPDGDAICSGLALTTALENAGKKAYMLCEQPPERLCLFPAMGKTYQSLPVQLNEIDLFIVVDCADDLRLGDFTASFNAFKGKTLNIDHHVSNPRFAKYNYVLPDSTA
ncbi:MAG: DHH family phosphoesterase, partial [Clostridia bacterium]|nr:DHH family phosphoesterase [Clostridia bacterium]